ncbi:hypothetical protein GIB67_014488 [Kingdonia uniflora]|uniref:Hydrophobic seed protein domain-containing protein n=1 Tax=Kingdonia uniflora TaxID=39325 RepID=A0A7J7LZF0_9MAGN|nr:hypothetical protein GIB67_014488 [Kingdonia uniflora]
MAFIGSKLVSLLIILNLIFFTCVSSCKVGCPPLVKPPKIPSVLPAAPAKCPINTLKLGLCANLLGGLLHIIIGLVDLDAAVCLCTAIKANVLGIILDVPVALSLLLNHCGKTVPNGFTC